MTSAVIAHKIMQALKGQKLDLQNEKQLQKQLLPILQETQMKIVTEYRLSPSSIPDFWIEDKVAVEVKIRGSRTKEVYRQCERYAFFTEVKAIVIITSKSMGFPDSLFGKPVYVINLSHAWL